MPEGEEPTSERAERCRPVPVARLRCIMEVLQQELPGICVYLDGILVTCRLHN